MRNSTTVRVLVLIVAALAGARRSGAQQAQEPLPAEPHFTRNFGLGFATSILAHESAHILTALALGAQPTFGFDTGRPTIYSGIDSHKYPHKQFLFSAAGLTTQSVMDEVILDDRKLSGNAFERGLLAGGIGTTLFYLTIGRRGSVSDVDFMARTHAMTKAQVTVLFGSIAAEHVVRIWRNPKYGNFFARPKGAGMELGLGLRF